MKKYSKFIILIRKMQAGCSMILVLMLMADSLLPSHPPVWAVCAQHICARQGS